MDQRHFATYCRVSRDAQIKDNSPVDQARTVDRLAHPFYDAGTVSVRKALVSAGA